MSASAADGGRKVICADGWRVTMHVEVRRDPLQGPDSERQGPTNRMSAAILSGNPTVRAPRHLTETERQVTSKAAVECSAPPLETNTRPPLQLNIVKRPTRTAAGQDQHTDSYQPMPDTGNRAGVPRASLDAASARMSSWPLTISRSSAIDSAR